MINIAQSQGLLLKFSEQEVEFFDLVVLSLSHAYSKSVF